MPTTDSITRPSLLLKSTLAATKKAKTDTVAKASQEVDSLGLLYPKKQNTFQLTDIHFAEEGYFKGNKYFKLGRGNAHADGVQGVPSPYAVSNDNTVTALLLGCFVMAMIAFSVSHNFIEKQIKSFFHVARSKDVVTETAYEVRFQLFLIAQTSLLFSILYYFFAHGSGYGGLQTDSQLSVIGCFFGIFMGYFLIKNLLYKLVNWVFFDSKSNGQWGRTWLFLSSLEGVLLFPLVLLQIYFSLSLQAAFVYALIVVLFVKMLTLYKSYTIFFNRKAVIMKIIMYFSSLEMIQMNL